MLDRLVNWLERAVKGEWAGIHFAANVFIATPQPAEAGKEGAR